MTHRSRGSARTALTRAAFVTAPLLILAYGVIRLTDPDHGPGPVWTTGHLALTAAMLLFVPVFARLWALARQDAGRAGRLSAGTATLLGLAGTLAVTVQACIDLQVGFRAADRPAMERLFEQVQSHPGVVPAVYGVGPLLFYVGLVWILVQLSARRRVGFWSPLAAVAGTAVAAAGGLDLMPLSAALFCASLAPLTRRRPAGGPSGRAGEAPVRLTAVRW
ncbi:hypothetical protein [Streptomyces lavendulae]|uniref:hypothetical protein n=1 Tax=Streptomyces lavendulae TaxID=1914 RepID=UPI0025566127|nr:hypothetical protein [Streptomyces lavendulae]